MTKPHRWLFIFALMLSWGFPPCRRVAPSGHTYVAGFTCTFYSPMSDATALVVDGPRLLLIDLMVVALWVGVAGRKRG